MELLTVEDLAEITGYKKVTIRRMIKRGDIKGKKLGRRWFVSKEYLQEYFKENEQEPEQEF